MLSRNKLLPIISLFILCLFTTSLIKYTDLHHINVYICGDFYWYWYLVAFLTHRLCIIKCLTYVGLPMLGNTMFKKNAEKNKNATFVTALFNIIAN